MIDSVLSLLLVLFLLFLVSFLSLVMASSLFHLKHRVPFVPTSAAVIDVMIQEAALKPGMTVLDLGAGDGRVLRRAMRRVPGLRTIGYEGALGVWLLAKTCNLCSRQKPEMRRENFYEKDVSEADVIFTYLSIEAMQKLLPKFERELKPGALVISNTFSIKQREALRKVFVKMPFWGGAHVHVYGF